MDYQASEIKKEHMHKSAMGKDGFRVLDVNIESYKSRLCYFPEFVTIKALSDAFRTARKE